MTTTVYTVRGMTCEHCVNSISKEFGALAGVSGVAVDLATGAVTVTSDAPLDADAVQAAVDEAGFELMDAKV
jgi:copper chaperone